MPKQDKTPKKKPKKKSPQKSGESEYPAMDQDEMNRLLQNAIEHAQAQLHKTLLLYITLRHTLASTDYCGTSTAYLL